MNKLLRLLCILRQHPNVEQIEKIGEHGDYQTWQTWTDWRAWCPTCQRTVFWTESDV